MGLSEAEANAVEADEWQRPWTRCATNSRASSPGRGVAAARKRRGRRRAALAAAASFAPAIALLHIGLPAMDGYEVATELRGRPGGGQMVLVAVTGYGRVEDRQRAREARFDHYLLKPIDFAALAEIVTA